ncbi:SMI1/KNR4 family protein [Streptomyces sp. NPDC005917]|uniref:SMI1/KNR4 family protein n=1 Tax=unclassified Streptomyces TaxID=2593676 RepID=UPI0033E9567B
MTDDEVFEAVRARVLEGRPTSLPKRPTAPAPASQAAVDKVERVVGYPLPPLLRRLYMEVADGGFGPFGGIVGTTDEEVLEGYVEYLEGELDVDEPPSPPRGVFFFCDFGCAMWALLDCRHPEGQMWWWEEGDRHKLDLTFPQWLEAWLDGRLSPDFMGTLELQEESWLRPMWE